MDNVLRILLRMDSASFKIASKKEEKPWVRGEENLYLLKINASLPELETDLFSRSSVSIWRHTREHATDAEMKISFMRGGEKEWDSCKYGSRVKRISWRSKGEGSKTGYVVFTKFIQGYKVFRTNRG